MRSVSGAWMFSSSADVSRGRKWRPGGVWRRARSALDRIFRRMYLVCTRMGMLFSDWRSAMLLSQPD